MALQKHPFACRVTFVGTPGDLLDSCLAVFQKEAAVSILALMVLRPKLECCRDLYGGGRDVWMSFAL